MLFRQGVVARPFLADPADVFRIGQPGFLFFATVGAVRVNFGAPFLRIAQDILQHLAVVHLRWRVFP